MEHPTLRVLVRALDTVLREIVGGSSPETGWLLNPGDPGLLRSLDRLSAAEASDVGAGGSASVAAHVEHLRYGIELLNRWTQGEDPYPDADWTAAWKRSSVTESEWARLRDDLRLETERWRENFPKLIEREETGTTAAVASAAHLAYHLGAIRQLHRASRGPSAEGK